MIRRLSEQDLADWKAIRLEALQLHPDAFGSSYDEEASQPDSFFLEWLSKNAIFASYDNGGINGCVGFYPYNTKYERVRHRGSLSSMYVRQTHWGSGLADALVKTVLTHAAATVEQIHCTVVTTNIAARKLYERHGFTIYGTEPRAMKVDGRYLDEYLMVKMLD